VGGEPHPKKPKSLDLSQPSTYGRYQSLISAKPVLDIPTKEIKLILGRLHETQHIEIAEIIATNCKVAAFEFYSAHALYRTKFSIKDKLNNPKLFQLSDGKFPQKPDDLDLRSWICKIQHLLSSQLINTPNGVSTGAIRGWFEINRYHYSGALNILRMLNPQKLLNALEFEESLCYAISWCWHLYASDCEARLKSLWAELHTSEIDESRKLNLDCAKIIDSYQSL
jgi:hypothetical protein